MNASDFTVIEETLQVRLPECYRAKLANYPFPSEEMELFSRAEEIVSQNQEYRKKGWFGFPWPAEFFVIGEDGCGNLYFIHLGSEDGRVFIADHDGGAEPRKEILEKMVSSSSLDAHVEETFENQKKIEEIAIARGAKKWWQLWR